jgi:hypothetical protein
MTSWADTFAGRTVASNQTGSWGTASNGEVYSNKSGSTATYTVASGVGTIATPATGQACIMMLGSNTGTDMESLCKLSGGANTDTIYTFLRLSDSAHYYRLDLTLPGTGLRLAYKNGGGFTTIGSNKDVNFTPAAGMLIWFRFRVQGTQLMAKAWQDGSAEPGVWLRDEIDNHVASGGVGIGCSPTTTNICTFDSFTANTIPTIPSLWNFGNHRSFARMI